MKTRSIDDLRKYALSLASLDQAEILKKLGIKHYDKNILKMAKPELLKNFGKSAKTLNKSLFIKNVIWQTFEKLQAGETPFDIGNLRSFWYYIKDTMHKAGAAKGDPYLIVSEMFMLMVKAGLFKYSDFGFDDDDKGNRWHARRHPQIILFAEKTAYNDLMQEVNRDFDITTICTGGQSSYLSIEYFVDELRRRGVDLAARFYIFSIVDFDPAGDIIATRFVENLQDNGIKNIAVFPGEFYKHFRRKDIVIPANMTKEQRKKVYILPLKVRKSGLAARWAAKTGGVNGKKGIMHGIETIVMTKAQIMKIFLEELSNIISIDFEQIAKYRQMETLRDQMQAFALKKLQLGL
ncbi:MAG TPA: hypothetical protein PKM56_11360 [Candidatus Rifleibacterium sp.]|jgi:hypothetical protein|nr:hypothetical protein [Candidatus Rifleibacterium sp.]